MPGDEWQRFANLRAYFANMYAHPGKKLLFMGSELAQYQEWSHDRSLDWHLLEHASHRGVQNVVRDLNMLYRKTPPLYELDFSAAGFEWIECNDRDNSILSWIRRDKSGKFVVCITNFTPVVRNDFRIGVPQAGSYVERLNTDAQQYGGSGISNPAMTAEPVASHNRSHSLNLALPALATLILEPAQPAAGN
jgi:1,4-alpha-glucan branching enzyme